MSFGLLAGIVVLGAILRTVGLADNPPGFFADEASIGFNAYSILTTGRDEHGNLLPFFFRAFGEYKFPIFIYANVPFVALFGMTEQAVRLTAAMFGTLTIVTLFLLAREMFSVRAGLAGAFLLAVTPWHIHYSRIGFELISFPFVFTLALFLFFSALRQPRLLTVAGAAFGLAFYTYSPAWGLVPLTLVVLGVFYWRQLLLYRKHLAIGGAVFLLVLVPFIIHMALGAGRVRLGETSILALGLSLPETLAMFIRHYFSYFSLDFLVREGDDYFVTRHYLPGFGHLFWLHLPLIAMGIGYALWRRSKPALVALALLALFPLSGALSNTSPISSRTILGPVVLCLLAGYGAAEFARALAGLRPPLTRMAAPALVALAIAGFSAWSLTGYLDRYHNQYPMVSADYWGWQYGPEEIVPYFVEVEDEYDELIMSGMFNAPYIFLRFYAPHACANCRIGDLQAYDPDKRQLFALTPEQLDPAFTFDTKRTITYPNGDMAFVVVEARRGDG